MIPPARRPCSSDRSVTIWHASIRLVIAFIASAGHSLRRARQNDARR
jgi:hypothetical protein